MAVVQFAKWYLLVISVTCELPWLVGAAISCMLRSGDLSSADMACPVIQLANRHSLRGDTAVAMDLLTDV
jgi:hypothetical protein